MKIKHVLVIVAATLTFFPALGNTTQAATWRKGTPASLRGIYQSTMPHKVAPAAGFAPVLTISKRAISFQESNYPNSLTKQLRYRKIGEVYYFKGVIQHIGWVLGGKTSFKLYKRGHYIYRSFAHEKANSGYPFKKTAHMKNY